MRWLRLALVSITLALVGCPAVYPELGTRTRTIPAGQPLDPAPPQDLRWIKFLSARIPDRTRDGRPWQQNGKASPYAKLLAGGREIVKTNPESDTLTPTWPDGPRGNFRLLPTDRMRVELWDSNPINDKPIGVRDLGPLAELPVSDGKLTVTFDEGIGADAQVVIAIEPAHAVSGLGLWYELRTEGCAVTRRLDGSPADRAGLVPGDEVLRIGHRDVKGLGPNDIKSAFNAVPMSGLELTVRHAGGVTAEVLLKEGPIYPTFEQFGAIE